MTERTSHWVGRFEELPDFLSLVYLCAPDRFPQEDFLRDDEQLTLEKAFDELAAAMSFVEDRISNQAAYLNLKALLERSLAEYRRGDNFSGSRTLQEFKRVLLANTSPKEG